MANTNRVVISKDSGKPKATTVYRLTDIEPQYVSLVTAGANRQKKFQVVKADDTQTAKSVPDASASAEDKRAAQEARANQYGIEALAVGANLSYPSGDPTEEDLYADPVNLKYPLGTSDNAPDANRIRNALARFKQAHSTYSEDKSKAAVFVRIVEAALGQGIAVSYNADDPIDQLLPQNIVQRLTEVEGGDKSQADKGDGNGTGEIANFSEWLNDASAQIEDALAEASLSIAMSSTSDSTPPSVGKQPAHVGKSQSAPSVEQLLEKSVQLETTIAKEQEQRKAIEKERDYLLLQIATLRKERDKARVQLSKMRNGVGGSTALITGNASNPVAKTGNASADPVCVAWAGGGDLSAKVAKSNKQ